ncbi:MAG: PCRF domain-containing protein [Clostridia bacterium]|nr:PCRF domain-containing protein [Clostridia bacterium]
MEQKIVGLLNRYEPISVRYVELADYLESPEIIADNRAYLKYAEEKNSLEDAYTFGEALKVAIELGDKEETEALYACLSQELLPKNERDERGAIVEMRAENPQSIPLMEELLGAYLAYSKKKGFTLNVCEKDEKFITLSVEGKGSYQRLKNETGVHHGVGGKIGNSNVWVSVIPIMDDVSVIIEDKDLRTDIFHSSGAGGQNINKVATAVRLTHLPSGIVVVCKEERSQLQNRKRAHVVLLSRLYEYYKEKELGQIKKERATAYQKSRTERARIYDFEREQITDLRIGQTLPLKSWAQGGLDELINAILIKESRK